MGFWGPFVVEELAWWSSNLLNTAVLLKEKGARLAGGHP